MPQSVVSVARPLNPSIPAPKLGSVYIDPTNWLLPPCPNCTSPICNSNAQIEIAQRGKIQLWIPSPFII